MLKIDRNKRSIVQLDTPSLAAAAGHPRFAAPRKHTFQRLVPSVLSIRIIPPFLHRLTPHRKSLRDERYKLPLPCIDETSEKGSLVRLKKDA